jgi:hyperosmotically inducible periplasmic protein
MKGLVLACSISLVILGGLQVGAGTAAAQGNRERLETDIRQELAPLVGVFDNVTFKVESDSTVTLSGQVRQSTLKKHIEEDTRKVEGVRGVHNGIEVLPLSGADDDLRLKLYRAIYSQEGLQRYSLQVNPPIHIVVKNGAVSLEGVVATKLEYAQVNAAANGVSGAFSVKNNLRVEGDA